MTWARQWRNQGEDHCDDRKSHKRCDDRVAERRLIPGLPAPHRDEEQAVKAEPQEEAVLLHARIVTASRSIATAHSPHPSFRHRTPRPGCSTNFSVPMA